MLDSFALLSGQLNTLNKVLKHEKTPLLRNQVIIPLVLSPDRDEEIMVRIWLIITIYFIATSHFLAPVLVKKLSDRLVK